MPELETKVVVDRGPLDRAQSSRTIRARAPLRVGLGGGGTDVSPFCDQHGGFVLNATVSLYAYAHLLPRTDDLVCFEAAEIGESYIGPAISEIPLEGQALLHRGVYNRIVRDFCGGRPLPMTLRTTADVPSGSGMGGSSTLVVAMLDAFRRYLGLPLGEYDLAHLAYEIERIDLGLNGGRQDHYAAAFGGFNFMEFYENDRVIVNPLRVSSSVIRELESSCILYYTGRSRESAGIIARQKANMVSGSSRTEAAMQALKMEALQMKEAVLTGDLRLASRTLNRGWQAKKDTAEGISNSEIDRILELAAANGAISGKVSGAGGGGFVFLMTDPFWRQKVIQVLAEQPGRLFPCIFSAEGAQSWGGSL